MQTRIIGITGYKQSGKDTVAESIGRKNLCDSWYKRGFADEIKDEVGEIFGLTGSEIDARKSNPVVRHLLQWYGTEFMKEKAGQDVWIKKYAEFINKSVGYVSKNTTTKSILFVIPDVRFPNEVSWIRELNGLIVKVDRFDSTSDTHASESHIAHIHGDFRVPNRGSLNDLEREVRYLTQFIKERWKI